MNFSTPADLAAWYYDHLYVHVGQVRAKGLICKAYVEDKGEWWEEFRNLAANLKFTLKGGRTLLRLIRDLMDKEDWLYRPKQYPPDPVYANSIALSGKFCDRCEEAKPFNNRQSYFDKPPDEAFNALYWDFVRDHRIALGFMRRLEEIIDRNGWMGTMPLDILEFQVSDVQSRIRWGWRCAEASYLGGLVTHGLRHDRDTLEMQAKRPITERPVEIGPDRQLCPACRANVIGDF